jgi:acyl-CoA oxidase
LLETFRAREIDLTASTAQRLKKRIDSGVAPFEAMAEVGDHLVSLARAHVERVLVEQFSAAVQSCDGPVRDALDRMCDLWALSRLEADAAWFLENGYFEAPRARAVRRVVNELCSEVRTDARALVDAFAIPDACLAAPIAFGDPAQLRW